VICEHGWITKEFSRLTSRRSALPFGSVAFDLEFRGVDQATLFRAAFAE
jgi:hypothetical protein